MSATSFRDFDLGDMFSWLRIRKKLSIFGLENSSLDIQDTAYGRTGGFHYPLKVLNLRADADPRIFANIDITFSYPPPYLPKYSGFRMKKLGSKCQKIEKNWKNPFLGQKRVIFNIPALLGLSRLSTLTKETGSPKPI